MSREEKRFGFRISTLSQGRIVIAAESHPIVACRRREAICRSSLSSKAQFVVARPRKRSVSLFLYSKGDIVNDARPSPTPMLVLLGILIFVHHFGLGLYYAHGLEPSPASEFLYSAAFLCCVVWWLRAEARRYVIKPIYCLGLLVGVGWIVIIPYHLFKTRGLRGLIPLSALIGSFLAAQILAMVVYMVVSS